MLEIHQIASKGHVDEPTTPLPDDLPAVFLFLLDIFGVIREVIWFTVTSAIGERSDERLRLVAKLCKHASSCQLPCFRGDMATKHMPSCGDGFEPPLMQATPR